MSKNSAKSKENASSLELSVRFPMVDEIRNRLDELTPRQRAVGQYILNNPESLAFMPIVELAHKIGVSQATIVRFSTAMGYQGYAHLSSEIRQAIQMEYGTADRFKLGRSLEGKNANEGDGSLFSRVITSEIGNLIRLAESIRSSQFADCVQRTWDADHLAIVGCQASYTLAVHMYQMIVKLLDKTDLFTQQSIHTTAKLHQYGNDSMVYLLSFPRYPTQSIDIAAAARKRGAHVVAVTDSQLSPAIQVADQTIMVGVDVPSFVDGYAAPIAFINALVTEIGMRRPHDAQAGFDHYDKLTAEMGVFHHKSGEWRPEVYDDSESHNNRKKRSHTK